MQEADSWVASLSGPATSSTRNGPFKSAFITRPDASTSLSFPRAYSLALAPQLIHARSELLSQLVSSRAYRQVEFLAVGSFYIFKPAADPSHKHSLIRIPSTREDVFSTTAITSKAKRGLMKFLKFVVDYTSAPQKEIWEPVADTPLVDFLKDHFKMDSELQTFVITLALSLDGAVTTGDGLAIIHRHLSSMGMFGVGFAAVYPKWGGLSEVAQVSCRAGAVGGAVYMLGTGIGSMSNQDGQIHLELTSGDKVKTKMLVRSSESNGDQTTIISRLVAVVGDSLKSLFEVTTEGAPAPAVAVIAFPPGSVKTASGKSNSSPIYVFAHSSDTGECPVGQSKLHPHSPLHFPRYYDDPTSNTYLHCLSFGYGDNTSDILMYPLLSHFIPSHYTGICANRRSIGVLYVTSLTTPDIKETLEQALQDLLRAVSEEGQIPQCLYELYYEQVGGSLETRVSDSIFEFPSSMLSLTFDDTIMSNVQLAWKKVMGDVGAETDEYMVFPDRNGGMDADDDMYD